MERIKITKELLATATKGNRFSQEQIRLGQLLTDNKQWKKALIDKVITVSAWETFKSLSKVKTNQVKKSPSKPAVLNSFPKSHDSWHWKPQTEDTPEVKFQRSSSKPAKKKAKPKKTSQKKTSKEFYASDAWLSLRARVLEKHQCKCMMCGRSPKEHGIVIHVDHIKPRSKHPRLELCFENLQLLCADCNLGKSNKFDTDWRP